MCRGIYVSGKYVGGSKDCLKQDYILFVSGLPGLRIESAPCTVLNCSIVSSYRLFKVWGNCGEWHYQGRLVMAPQLTQVRISLGKNTRYCHVTILTGNPTLKVILRTWLSHVSIPAPNSCMRSVIICCAANIEFGICLYTVAVSKVLKAYVVTGVGNKRPQGAPLCCGDCCKDSA